MWSSIGVISSGVERDIPRPPRLLISSPFYPLVCEAGTAARACRCMWIAVFSRPWLPLAGKHAASSQNACNSLDARFKWMLTLSKILLAGTQTTLKSCGLQTVIRILLPWLSFHRGYDQWRTSMRKTMLLKIFKCFSSFYFIWLWIITTIKSKKIKTL